MFDDSILKGFAVTLFEEVESELIRKIHSSLNIIFKLTIVILRKISNIIDILSIDQTIFGIQD